MKSLDEKKLLAKMARNIGQPDIPLEESIRLEETLNKQLFEDTRRTPILVETPEVIQEVVHHPDPPKAFEPMGKIPKVVTDMQRAEMGGLRKQINDISQRVNTLAFGGGGTGIVRIGEADDVVRASLANNIAIKYMDGAFIGTRELPTGNLIVANSASSGIKVNINNPVYGWRDIIGNVQPKAIGVGSPARTLYRGAIYDYAFVQNDQCDFVFHIPHDYVPGSDLFYHVHWSHNGTQISGLAEFTISHMYAKGHNQEEFSIERTIVISHDTINVSTTPRYRHFIDEIAISGQVANSNVFASNTVEVDGLLICTLHLSSHPTITGGSLFIHTCDIHYQSTNMATLGKAPNFYTGNP
jgi:hypothetical protein